MACWIAEAPDDWSRRALDRATDAFVDTTACMLAGADDPAALKARSAVSHWGSGASIVVVGGDARLPAPWAALVNGTAAHALDYDDVLEIANAHVSAALVPALLALGMERDAAGKACLDAFIVGVEIMARLGEAVNMAHYYRGWHTTLTLGAPAVAAACARLLQLDADRARAAISMATSMASGAKRQFGTMTKPLHAGLAAKNGLVAAVMAEAGVTAADDVFEATRGFVALYAGTPIARLDAALDRLGAPPAIEQHGLWQKLYPCCASAHRPLDAALALRADAGLQACAIERVDTHVPEVAARNLTYPTPANAMEARFSMHYLLASALTDGHLALDAFDREALNRPDVAALAARVHMHSDSTQPGDANVDAHPQSAAVDIHTTDGRVLSRRVADPKGHPRNALAAQDLADKFSGCATRALSPDAAEVAREAITALGAGGSVSAVAELLVA